MTDTLSPPASLSLSGTLVKLGAAVDDRRDVWERTTPNLISVRAWLSMNVMAVISRLSPWYPTVTVVTVPVG